MNSLFTSFRRNLLLNPNPHNQFLLHRLLSSSPRSFPSIPVEPLIQRLQSPAAHDSTCTPPHHIAVPDLSTISNLLENTNVAPGSSLASALDETGIEPSVELVQALFDRLSSSPMLLHSVYKWAETKPGFTLSPSVFDSVINSLCKAREFEIAWSLIFDRVRSDEGSNLVSADTFIVLIRRYARAGIVQQAIRAFEFARSYDPVCKSASELKLLEVLLDTLCKEGHVREASMYLERIRVMMDSNWVPSVRIFNILLNGWFRSRKLKQAEKLWEDMKAMNVKPTVVTYGTLIEGYCSMRRVEIAMEVLEDMKMAEMELNFMVFNPIIEGLGEAGRLQEALGMMERFFVCESGPTIVTYNSLVKNFCKAGDLSGASKILKMMMTRGVDPTPTTYNHFFKYFSKHGMTEAGMNLYFKLIEAGHSPDRLTYHLILKMLCEDGKLSLAMQVIKEMKNRGIDPDLLTTTMLIHLLCRLDMWEESFEEFENAVRRGIIPQYITFKMIDNGLRLKGMTDMAKRLSSLMSSLPHSKKLPNTYREAVDGPPDKDRRKSILHRAEAMSDVLKGCRNPRKLVKMRGSHKKAVHDDENSIDDVNEQHGDAKGFE
ncbi:PREDICTED: pentatricopeptide repeat-containing protein At5g11310, mitochondrial-like [Camelina sativa]|uniref:Pentatricopeptide repeat-containing protein At5g11310, mitochondrial-like n=1 Tax=Camelina sativa TaxID=90675 RepID=A0ABM0T1X7_CAMSA|nr:PREDICTED: pentatricopeptide repeat-containing protein At5g11310, mitochondrial-like [Camelina sativa]